jgi:hypothetical protein
MYGKDEKMRLSTGAVAVAAALSIGAAMVFAQWPAYSSGVPKTAEGKPDLTAPTPRTADGKPDFTGTWTLAGGGGRAGAQDKGKQAAPPPAPPTDGPAVGYLLQYRRQL